MVPLPSLSKTRKAAMVSSAKSLGWIVVAIIERNSGGKGELIYWGAEEGRDGKWKVGE